MAGSKPKLLIVEDDEGLQAQLKWAYDDYEVVIAGTREAALAAMRAEEPEVVTLDLGLPPDPDGTTEGFAVLDAIMAMKPDTKVIVASGHGARESALQAIERGAYDFYQKPVDIDTLGLIVDRALRLHRIEQENRRLSEKVGEDQTVLDRGHPQPSPELCRRQPNQRQCARRNHHAHLHEPGKVAGQHVEPTGKAQHQRQIAADDKQGEKAERNCARRTELQPGSGPSEAQSKWNGDDPRGKAAQGGQLHLLCAKDIRDGVIVQIEGP